MIENFGSCILFTFGGLSFLGLSVSEEQPKPRRLLMVIGIGLLFVAVLSMETRNNQLLNEITAKLAKDAPVQH